MPEYFKIGKIVATYGFAGELVLLHALGKKSSLKGLKALFLEEKNGSVLPWFIESARIKSETEIFLKLEGIHTKEAATPVLQKEVWLPEEDFKKYAARSAPASLLGYEVIHEGKSLGNILELIEQPHQMLCRLEIEAKEVLIPLNESSLKKVDQKKKQVVVELPEGLLEIYLK
jgi:16S rRNA processing protein RimM